MFMLLLYSKPKNISHFGMVLKSEVQVYGDMGYPMAAPISFLDIIIKMIERLPTIFNHIITILNGKQV